MNLVNKNIYKKITLSDVDIIYVIIIFSEIINEKNKKILKK